MPFTDTAQLSVLDDVFRGMTLDEFRESWVAACLAFGGLIFNLLPDLRERLPGHFLGESLDNIVHSVEQQDY